MTVASDQVQHSAFPTAVARWQATATPLVAAYWPAGAGGSTPSSTSAADVSSLVAAVSDCPGQGGADPGRGGGGSTTIESTLTDLGWRPVYDDDKGFSSGRGIDLLMLDPTLERLVAIEVKSTIHPRRWPRLDRGRSEQLTPEWLDGPRNTGMLDSAVSSADVYMMVAQIHLGRRKWRCCLAGGPSQSQPVTEEGQLMNLDWVAPNST